VVRLETISSQHRDWCRQLLSRRVATIGLAPIHELHATASCHYVDLLKIMVERFHLCSWDEQDLPGHESSSFHSHGL
jgi:hypothetical protein